MKCILIFLVFVLPLSPLIIAGNLTVISSNGKLVVNIFTQGGKPLYNVTYNGVLFLENSPLGMKTNVGDFSQGLTLGETVTRRVINETYELPSIKQRIVHYNANEGVFTFSKGDSPAFDVIFRVSNNNIAFKYRVHRQGRSRVAVIFEEITGFVFPEGTTTFLTPQSRPMTGWMRTMPSYEMPYTADAPMGTNGIGEGFTFPCLFRIKDKGWVLVSETGVDGRYCASRLIGHTGGLYTIGFPMEGENNGNGTVSPGIPLPGYTPWRTITVGETLEPIVETTITWDVVKPLYEPSKNYANYFGRGVWSWIIKMEPGTIFEVQKQYIDFAAAMGYESVLVDALWDVQIGRDRIVELAEYAASRNVALYLWYNSNGFWNDAPQTPKGKMDNSIARRREMQWMQSIGIRGIKVDFFGGDKQVTMQLYQDILYDANDFGLLVFFHGCTLPRGWERMFPNFVSSEAVLASEMLHFHKKNNYYEAFNATLHPFIRNTVGAMDFGGSVLNRYWNANNTPGVGNRRLTSDVFQIATAVLFQSPVQHFALAPNNLTDAPKWAIDFMKDVPAVWDETQFIAGYPGRYVVLARRQGTTWYIAAVNARKETLNINVNLPMIEGDSKLIIYSDDEQLNGRVTTAKLRRNQQINLNIPNNGGTLIVYRGEDAAH